MTRDGRFKREVRRVARVSGEPYTRARARFDEARRNPRPTDHGEPRWTVLYTFAGVEDWLRGWLISNFGADLGHVLVPSYQGGPIVPGMLLLEVTREAGLAELQQLPHLTDYLGAPAEPKQLTWEGLREVLRSEGTRARRRLAHTGSVGGQGQVGVEDAEAVQAAPEDGGEDLGTRAEVEHGRHLPEESPYDRPGRFPRVPRGSESEERETQELLLKLSDGPTRDDRAEAKTALLLAHDRLVENIVTRFSAYSVLPRAELLDAGRQGLSHAVESYHRVHDLAPPSGCRRVDFHSYAAWCVRQSVVRRIAEAG